MTPRQLEAIDLIERLKEKWNYDFPARFLTREEVAMRFEDGTWSWPEKANQCQVVVKKLRKISKFDKETIESYL